MGWVTHPRRGCEVVQADAGCVAPGGPRVRNRQVCTAYLVFRFMPQPIYLRSFGMKPKGDVTRRGFLANRATHPRLRGSGSPLSQRTRGEFTKSCKLAPGAYGGGYTPAATFQDRAIWARMRTRRPRVRSGRLRYARPPRGLAPALSPPPDRHPARACACRGQTSRAASASRSGP